MIHGAGLGHLQGQGEGGRLAETGLVAGVVMRQGCAGRLSQPMGSVWNEGFFLPLPSLRLGPQFKDAPPLSNP